MTEKESSGGPQVVLAEPDAATSAGLRMALEAAAFDIVAEARTADEAVDAALHRGPQAVIVAGDLPGGWESAVLRIARERPAIALVVMAHRVDGEELLSAVLAGATGYLDKGMQPERLPAAINGVLAGEVALPRQLTRHLLAELRRRDHRRVVVEAHARTTLSNREWEMLQMLAEGCTTADMASRLGISPITVRRHVSSLMTKLGVSTRADAIALIRAPEY